MSDRGCARRATVLVAGLAAAAEREMVKALIGITAISNACSK
ncbi:hypothetical protein QNO07_16585 [Streptomyces sp. 549]|nr:hypothetical protein [Streptomyces sp. 549]MDK1475015.1 hypothetical protein [Streptomyces sp. 549]